MSRWVFGSLLSAAVVAFTLGSVWATTPDDLVSEHEANCVVGGAVGCQCAASGNCTAGNGTGCSGWGLCAGGTCAVQAQTFSNSSVCGGCNFAVYANTSGCGG